MQTGDAHTCARCGAPDAPGASAIPGTSPGARGPTSTTSAYSRVAGRTTVPTASSAAYAAAAAPPRVQVSSRKVAPSLKATQEARERQRRAEEMAALEAELTFTRPRAPPAGERAEVPPRSPREGSGEGVDEDDGYYILRERPEPTPEERVEALRREQEEGLQERYAKARRRQGVARRPRALLRTRYGQLQSIDSVAHKPNAGKGEETAGAGPRLIAGAPPTAEEAAPGQTFDGTSSEGRATPSEPESDAVDDAPVSTAEAQDPPQLVHPSEKLEIDLEDDEELQDA